MKFRLLFLLFFLKVLQLQAQSETSINFNTSKEKNYDGFILDMGTMLNAEALTLPLILPSLNSFTHLDFTDNALKINPESFKINTSKILFDTSSIHQKQLLGNSYRLNNGIQINTYGEYDINGYKRYSPSIPYWLDNKFKAAFEMKSSNGKFGIKLEITGGARGY